MGKGIFLILCMCVCVCVGLSQMFCENPNSNQKMLTHPIQRTTVYLHWPTCWLWLVIVFMALRPLVDSSSSSLIPCCLRADFSGQCTNSDWPTQTLKDQHALVLSPPHLHLGFSRSKNVDSCGHILVYFRAKTTHVYLHKEISQTIWRRDAEDKYL